jgi:integrase
VGQAAASREPVQVIDVLDERQYAAGRFRPMLQQLGYRSLLAVPLLREQQIMGGLTIFRRAPNHLKPLVEFLYQSGWRKGEGSRLEWRDVDLNGRIVRLRIENSKNKEARVLPLDGRLFEIMEERKRERRLDCPYVFHLKGNPIKEFRKTWRAACIAAGLGRLEKIPGTKRKKYSGTIVHDLRRCAARNLSRAGVLEAVAMEITGHKTRSMYRRYRIVDENDLREATALLQTHLKNEPTTASVERMRANG